MIKIIHISDFHLESENLTVEKINIINALTSDLKSHVDKNTILCITGDIIDKGALCFKEKEDAYIVFETVFIDKIIEENPDLKGKIFIVPGNHDVDRDKIDAVTEAGLKASLNDEKALNSFIIANRNESIHLGRIKAYLLWENDFYSKYNKGVLTNFDNSFVIATENYNIGVTCLNSAWLCKDDNDMGNLLIGKNQLENSLKSIEKTNVKIALAHHPIEFIKKFDKDSVKSLLYKHYDVFLTGHVHELEANYTKDLFGSIFVSIANSTVADNPKDKKHSNGYTIIEFSPERKYKVIYRKYVELHNKFVPNTDIGTEDGSKTFEIPAKDTLSRFSLNQTLITSIESRYCEKLNEHILMSDNNTTTKCTIEHLFVHPTILNAPQDSLEKDEIVNYKIDDIIKDSSNYLIYGLKESGKTILLDKIFIDTINGFSKYEKFPVLVKFGELRKKDPKKLIKEFIGIPTKEVDEFLNSNNVLLLIDDVYFNGTSSDEILKLKELIIQFPKIQLVASSTQILENVIPTEYLKYNDYFDFNLAFIQNFSTAEIKQLITKWFDGREVDLQENMQKLIKSFGDFGLPRTPLSITLFLWIFEKQEKRPINNSVLVEMFVENLLEKTKLENIYSETFGFKNKKRLLSFIAKYMKEYGNEDLSYCIDYIQLLSYVTEYLKSRFTGKPQIVLEDFVKRGILSIEDDNTIKFKSAFFFHFFLALHFEYDSTFKTEVFSGENYLNYLEEINYYTGLKGDDEEILKFTQDKLEYVYGDFNKTLIENWDKIDYVLESKKNEDTITFQIDENKAKKKLTSEQENDIYDESLSNIPIKQKIEKKDNSNLDSQKNIDKVLKLAATVLKNSEDVDSFELKKSAYNNIITSSIAFLMQYRDSLIHYYVEHKKEPLHFPKNIDFSLFIRILPLIHQVVVYNWLGTKKIRTVLVDKIQKDKETVNISDFEKYLSVFIFSDIKGVDYPENIRQLVKNTKYRYIKDLSFLKIMSYYHLRNNEPELDNFYLKLMSEIKCELGQIKKQDKGKFIENVKSNKENQ